MTVNMPRPTPSGSRTVRKAVLSATPVTMPGSAIGRTIMKEMVSRPKNLKRWTAKAMSVPRTKAIAVAPSPALTEVHSAARAPVLRHASPHQ